MSRETSFSYRRFTIMPRNYSLLQEMKGWMHNSLLVTGLYSCFFIRLLSISSFSLLIPLLALERRE